MVYLHLMQNPNERRLARYLYGYCTFYLAFGNYLYNIKLLIAFFNECDKFLNHLDYCFSKTVSCNQTIFYEKQKVITLAWQS